jgi:LPS-assembly lipoprotein
MRTRAGGGVCRPVWLFLAVAVLLGGCGFHLRGDYDLPERISPLWISGVSRFDEFHRRLSQRLEASGISVAGDAVGARAVLELRGYGGDQFITALDDQGKVAEYELARRVSFSLRDAATREVLIPWRRLEGTRLYSLAPATGFGKAMEREEIIDQLDQGMVDDILRILSMELR